MIAASFARIFFRNAINIGLPILECPEAAAGISEGSEVDVNLATGEPGVRALSLVDRTMGRNPNGGRSMVAPAVCVPAVCVQEIAEAGGIINFLKRHEIQELIA